MKIKRLIFIGLVALCLTLTATAQNSKVDALKKQIQKTEEDIRRNTALLNATEKNRKASQRELDLVHERITSRRTMVAAMQAQIDILNSEMHSKQTSVDRLSSQQRLLKEEYGNMIRESYKNYLQNNYLAFLFASRDFNDMTRRIDYMRRYNAMREGKSAHIDSLSGILRDKINEIDTKIDELDKAKAALDREMGKLNQDEKRYNSTLTELKNKESKISKEIAAKKEQTRIAQQEISRIIAEEAKKQSKQVLSAEERREVTALSGRFDQNRGKLPYPVRGGVIISRYGLHQHYANPRLTENNQGVTIAASKGSAVRSVFEGTVSGVVAIPRVKYSTVFIRHGEYLTVYSNLETVSVKSGDKVAMNQNIGALPNSDDADEHVLYFGVWKSSVSMNPESWLIR